MENKKIDIKELLKLKDKKEKIVKNKDIVKK